METPKATEPAPKPVKKPTLYQQFNEALFASFPSLPVTWKNGQRFTSMNREQQRTVWEAAEAKRERKAQRLMHAYFAGGIGMSTACKQAMGIE
jgi:hypothetical protein